MSVLTVYHEAELTKPVEALLGDDLVPLDIGTIIYVDPDWQPSEYDDFLLQAHLDFSPEMMETVIYVRLSEINFLKLNGVPFVPILPVSSYKALYPHQNPEEPEA